MSDGSNDTLAGPLMVFTLVDAAMLLVALVVYAIAGVLAAVMTIISLIAWTNRFACLANPLRVGGSPHLPPRPSAPWSGPLSGP